MDLYQAVVVVDLALDYQHLVLDQTALETLKGQTVVVLAQTVVVLVISCQGVLRLLL